MSILTASLYFCLGFLFLFSFSLWPILFRSSKNRGRKFFFANVLNFFLLISVAASVWTAWKETQKTKEAFESYVTEKLTSAAPETTGEISEKNEEISK